MSDPRRWRAGAALIVLALSASACGTSSDVAGTDVVATSTAVPTSSVTVAPTVLSTNAPPTTTAPPTTAPPTTMLPPTTATPTTVGPTTAPATTAPPNPCDSLPTGVTATSIDAGGSVHDLRIYVPAGYQGSGLLPVVLDWHGYNQNGDQQAALSGFEALAETEGFVVVHPTGVPNPGRSANGWELDPARDPGRDDMVFAGALIDELIASWCVDPSRVYSSGMSDGGFFTSLLICEMSDRIAAATSVAGVLRPAGCNPSRIVPYTAFHGTADPIEPFAKDLAAFDVWATAAGCGPPELFALGAELVEHKYGGCPFSFYEVVGGGHSWPGSPIAAEQPASLGYTTMEIDATAASWGLFKAFTLAG